MKRYTSKAALTIIVSAALFLGCHSRETDSSITQHLLEVPPVTVNAVQILPADTIADSLVVLGNTGYTVRVPYDCRMKLNNDSSFSFIRIGDTCRCAKLKLEWTFHGVVPGSRIIKRASYSVLGSQVEFAERPLVGQSCVVRSGLIQTDETPIQIECVAPPGGTMEQLFAIALTLQEVTDTMTTH